MFSIYTSLYNLEAGFIDWREALANFEGFADEVVVGTTSSLKDNTINLLSEYIKTHPKVKLTITNFSLESAEFDGQIKNAAMQQCTRPYCILLDADEFIPISTKERWVGCTTLLCMPQFSGYHGFLIASVNLCGDMSHYKDIGYKFYIHRNDKNLNRGVVNYARLDNGKIDINKSDTTEIIDKDGKLARMCPLSREIGDLKYGNFPFVFHKWAVDLDKRIKQNKFWKPVWENRAGKEVNNIVLNKENLEKIEVFEHNLPLQ